MPKSKWRREHPVDYRFQNIVHRLNVVYRELVGESPVKEEWYPIWRKALYMEFKSALQYGVCRYCRKDLTVKNIQADHNVPISKYRTVSKKQKTEVNNVYNIRFICSRCNKAKGDFSDEQFSALLGVADTWQGRQQLITRLNMGSRCYVR